jgi:hypothetical protein
MIASGMLDTIFINHRASQRIHITILTKTGLRSWLKYGAAS